MPWLSRILLIPRLRPLHMKIVPFSQLSLTASVTYILCTNPLISRAACSRWSNIWRCLTSRLEIAVYLYGDYDRRLAFTYTYGYCSIRVMSTSRTIVWWYMDGICNLNNLLYLQIYLSTLTSFTCSFLLSATVARVSSLVLWGGVI